MPTKACPQDMPFRHALKEEEQEQEQEEQKQGAQIKREEDFIRIQTVFKP
jgi:hypothetical protein